MGMKEPLKSPGRVGPSFLQKDEANTMAFEETALSLDDLHLFVGRSHESTNFQPENAFVL